MTLSFMKILCYCAIKDKNPFQASAKRHDWHAKNMANERKNLLGVAIVFLISIPAIFFSSFVLSGALDAYDEGMHFLNSAMFRSGKVPYLDYYPLFPPIWVYSQILIDSIFGHTVLVQRLWFVLQSALVVAASYAALTRFVKSRLITITIPVLIVILCLDAYWVPRWSGARLAAYLVFLLILRRLYSQGSGVNRWRFMAGLFTGASNLYALDTGIHLTLVGAFILFVSAIAPPRRDFKTGFRDLATVLCGFALPLALWAAYLAYHGTLSQYLSVYYIAYIVRLMPISAEALSGGDISALNPRIILLVLFLFSLGLWFLYIAAYKGMYRKGMNNNDHLALAAIALSVLSSVSTIRAVMGSQYTMFAFIPMLMWFGFFLDSGVRCLQGLSGIMLKGVPVLLLTLSVLLAAAVLSGAVLKDGLRSKYDAVKASIAGVSSYQDDSRPRLAALKGLFEPNYFDAYAIYLGERTMPDEPIWAFPMHVEILPALAGRHNASQFPIPIILMGSPEHQSIYLAQIEKEQPRYLVFNPEAQIGRFKLEPYYKQVYRYIYANYTPDPGFPSGEFNPIWIRKVR